MLVLVHSGPWLYCALVANDWLRSGATVLDLSQRARPGQSTKGSARRSLVEQTLTTDIVVRATIYEVRTLAIDCGSRTHMFVLCRLMPHESAHRTVLVAVSFVCRVVSCCMRVSPEGRLATSESAVRVAGPTDSCLASPPPWCREHDRSVPLFNVNELIHHDVE